MKSFKDLSAHQKDKATDKALETLVKLILEYDWDYKFHSPIAQKHFYDAITIGRSWREWDNKSDFEMVMESDEIAEELWDVAECMAEVAYYPTNDEYCLMYVV